MHLEISIGTHFLISYLYNKLPRRSIDLLYENLLKALAARYKGHWYTKTPLKGTAFRCIKLPLDPLVKAAALESNIVLSELVVLLPDLNLWIDPGEVAYNLNDDDNNITILWNSKVNNIEKLLALTNQGQRSSEVINDENDGKQGPALNLNFGNGNGGFGGKLEMQMLEHLVPAHAQVGVGIANAHAHAQTPTVAVTPATAPAAVLMKPAHAQKTTAPPTTPLSSSNLMTTAAFAQTKFGSTKLKINNSKKLLRQQMSPVEFSNYIKSKQQAQLIGKLENIWGGGVGIHCGNL